MRNLIIPLVVILLLVVGCGGDGGDERNDPIPTPVNLFPPVLDIPSPTPVPIPPTPLPPPQSFWVGNTDGEGVYLRNTPSMDDKQGAFPDGTEMVWLGDEANGDGHHWYKVRTPDELIGWIPTDYLVDSPP